MKSVSDEIWIDVKDNITTRGYVAVNNMELWSRCNRLLFFYVRQKIGQGSQIGYQLPIAVGAIRE